MFGLIELSIGSFIIVKSSDVKNEDFPINVHGILEVIESEDKYVTLLKKGKASAELIQSNELEELKKEAIELTEDAIADEFPD